MPALYHVDAFTAERFKGNPAAVVLLDKPADAGWMQSFANEMNLAETAFVYRRPDESGFDLRWFTPTIEVDLCGHATLAAAHVLWESGWLDAAQTAKFQTRSGELICIRQDDWIEMDFPAAKLEPTIARKNLIEALGVDPIVIVKTPFDYLIQLKDESAVRTVSPDFNLLKTVPTRGVIITAGSDDQKFHFVSRFFAPAAGINEDPVTGSAHCALAVFWQPILNRTRFLARQLSPRGGTLRIQLQDHRVLLAGQAVTIFVGNVK